MIAEIITIGDELLIGQVVNTNAAFIAGKLTEIGVAVRHMTTVSDEMDQMLDAFRQSWSRADLVIVTGGLGPTHDDITKKGICEFFGTKLVSNDEVRKNVERLVAARNARWTNASEEQTMFPEGAVVLLNRLGSAAGILFERDQKMFIALPGVPYEMISIIDEEAIPLLRTRLKGPALRQLTLRTTGIAESKLAEKLGDIDQLLLGARLAFLPSPTGVRLRITVSDTDPVAAEKRLHDVEKRIRSIAAEYIFGSGTEELEEVLGNLLIRKKLTLAVAESCTGGLIGDRLTDVSGSSFYLKEDIVAYSNEAKIRLLGIRPDLIKEHGAVSREVAEAMAEGVRRGAGTDIGISTTGIAGPTGGNVAKPVGLVWIGYSDSAETTAIRFQYGSDRRRVKERAATAAMELVRRKLLKRG